MKKGNKFLCWIIGISFLLFLVSSFMMTEPDSEHELIEDSRDFEDGEQPITNIF